MPLPTCDPWTANTTRTSAQLAACRETTARALDHEMLEMQFLLTVIDALERKAQGAAGTFLPLSGYDKCVAETNAKNAVCALGNMTPPFQADVAELKQMILWQLGNGLCP